MLEGATRYNVPQQIVNTEASQLGSFRYNQPLQEDINVERNNPDLLSAFKSNPYTKSLGSY
jgi:hypothetical protein